jgi:hypothetical protein
MSETSQSTLDLAMLKTLIAKRARHARELEKIERQLERSLSRLSASSARPKFDFYEQVRVIAATSARRKLKGRTGYVLGRSADSRGRWGYAVLIEDVGETWDFVEHQLRSTGEFAKRKDFYDGSSVRVRVGGDGTGRIVGRGGKQSRNERNKS